MVGWWSTGAGCLDCGVCLTEVLKSRRGKPVAGSAGGWLILAAKVRWHFQAPTQNRLWWYCTSHHSPGHWNNLLIRADWLIPATRARLILALRDSSGTQKSLRNLSWRKPHHNSSFNWTWSVSEIKQGVMGTLCSGDLYHIMTFRRNHKSEQHQLYYVLSLWGWWCTKVLHFSFVFYRKSFTFISLGVRDIIME